MKDSTAKTIAEISQKAASLHSNGAFHREQTAIGEVACCAVKVHSGRNPFASYRLNWLLDNKRTALDKIARQLDAA